MGCDAAAPASIVPPETGPGSRIRPQVSNAETDATRKPAARAMGLEMLPRRGYESNTVSAIRYPPGVDDRKFRRMLEEEQRTVVQGGQAQLKGKIFRIGHMGIVTLQDLVAGFTGIEAVLAKLGHTFARGTGIGAVASFT